MKKIFIYLFSDEDALPKYVGKTKNMKQRIYQHCYNDRFKYDTYFYRWLNKQIAEDNIYYIDILEECNEKNWKERECYWIAHIKENNYPLCNMTNGGEGNNNQVFSEETRKKMSKAQIGRKHTEESKKKMSENTKGRKLSEETKEKLRQVNLGKKLPKEVRLKRAKPIIMKDLNNNFIKEFDSLTDASLFLNCRKSSLSNAMNKKIKSFKNYLWEFK